ncbi:conjugal transfer protein TrbC [Verminephrobacter aporrectodeae subsp. tuberculatae]|uniref:TrbC/VirB2 family protein n=1 Tax=Verminephrobacter aporrectodeae TaxID=1110389 RepID=UPI0022446FCF|nr:TrbC/VirB2 family protein [Verminephrobacter aporrectodeae]MCW8200290.1 conjugal transfer protein TrbC [Verminephrobacter aporrectodeae subsp. tuberculatae]
MTTATTSACSPASPSFLVTPYFWLAVLALLLLLGTIDPVHAVTATENSGGGQGLPWEAPLAKLRQSISGPVAFTIALLGIIACGASLIWGGEISDFVRRIVYVVLVVCLIVFANAMLSSAFTGATVPASAHISMPDLTACAQAKAGCAAASVKGAGSH